jgi:hypothetical protein
MSAAKMIARVPVSERTLSCDTLVTVGKFLVFRTIFNKRF